MEKITFKQYLDSKQKLIEAVKKVPERTATYRVRKYCKLIVGENKGQKNQITLKPNYNIEVQWLYEDINNPTPINIKFSGIKDIDESQEFNTYWQGKKLLKWLIRNTFEQS
jgi:hypothetical protein